MERCAVFVDAGWFLSEAAQAMTGRSSRSAIECDYARLAQTLSHVAEQATQLPLLRIYWYDAAADGVPTAEHLEIAALPNVKLRLGRISHREQKGVDALLILDVTTLARERAIASALVVSGDEDIREGLATAQSLGVRVTLGGVPIADGRPSQATTLVHEADDVLLMDLAVLSRSIHVRQPAPVPVGAPHPGVGQDASGRSNEVPTPRRFGYEFGTAHADRLSDAELRMLQREAPEVPADVAAQLFRDAEQVFGSTRGRPEMRRELRMGFWDHIMQRRNSPVPERSPVQSVEG
jgi:uncharacterized LabA/DUF88 family protein